MPNLTLEGNWNVESVTKQINQIAVPNEYLGNTFFKNRVDLLSENFKIPIKRGDSVIMTALAKGAPRPLIDDVKQSLISASLSRFGEEKTIMASELQNLAYFTNEYRIQREADLITNKQREVKRKFSATLEYMRMGAIIGSVKDGEDNELFSFSGERTDIEFKNQTPMTKIDEISDSLVDEFGYTPNFMILASRGFYEKIRKYCVDNKLFEKNIAKIDKMDNVNVLDYNGTIVMPYTVKYKNNKGEIKKFIPDNKAYSLPVDTPDTFIEYFSYAQNLDAMVAKPQQYFSNIYKLPKGDGYNIISETLSLPVCVRPYAIKSLIWTP